MRSPRFRLVKKTTASGFCLYIIEEKFMWWWEYVDSYTEKDKALAVLLKLRAGSPASTREVIA